MYRNKHRLNEVMPFGVTMIPRRTLEHLAKTQAT